MNIYQTKELIKYIENEATLKKHRFKPKETTKYNKSEQKAKEFEKEIEKQINVINNKIKEYNTKNEFGFYDFRGDYFFVFNSNIKLKKELLQKDEERKIFERETYINKINKAVDEIKQKLIFKDDKEIKKLLEDFKKL